MLWLRAVVAVYFVLCVPPNPGSSPEKNRLTCSREGSSIVRHFIQTLWKPIFKRFEVRVPEECPLHFSHDVFKAQVNFLFDFGRIFVRIWSSFGSNFVWIWSSFYLLSSFSRFLVDLGPNLVEFWVEFGQICRDLVRILVEFGRVSIYNRFGRVLDNFWTIRDPFLVFFFAFF